MQIQLPHTPHCLVCGKSNPIGLHLTLNVDPIDNTIHTIFTPGQHHVGFENLLHGGLLATILDEAMVWAAIWHTKRPCVAAELTTRFKNPARPHISLTCTAKITTANRRIIETTGELRDPTGTPIATATAKYMPTPNTEAFVQTLVHTPETTEAIKHLTA